MPVDAERQSHHQLAHELLLKMKAQGHDPECTFTVAFHLLRLYGLWHIDCSKGSAAEMDELVLLMARGLGKVLHDAQAYWRARGISEEQPS